MTEIVMQVRGGDSVTVDSSARNVRQDLANQGARVEALHPGASDPALRGWFLVIIPAGRRPGEFVRRLLEHPDVEAAYEKPPGTPP